MKLPEWCDAALKYPKPEVYWKGEPLLGSTYDEAEIDAAVGAMREAMDIHQGFGFSASPIPEFESEFAAWCGANHAIAINSAGPGLDMLMRSLNLQPGDEVIVPSANYQAAPLAVMGAGGQVIWGDIDPLTLQLDPADVERKLSPRTRAIFPVHMNGLAAPIAAYEELAAAHPHPEFGPPKIFGDAARSAGARYRGQPLGAHGDATVFSFHTMKNMTTLGEGGMVTCNDEALGRFCRSTRMYGSGEEVWGTSNVMTKVQAAVGRVQLAKLDGFIEARHALAKQRDALLADIPELTLPVEPADCRHSYYLYTLQVPVDWAGEKRDAVIKLLAEEYNVGCAIANKPVYLGRKLVAAHTAGQRTPIAEAVGERIFAPSLHPAMDEDLNRYICAAVATTIARLR